MATILQLLTQILNNQQQATNNYYYYPYYTSIENHAIRGVIYVHKKPSQGIHHRIGQRTPTTITISHIRPSKTKPPITLQLADPDLFNKLIQTCNSSK